MLELLSINIDKIVAYRLDGAITEDAMEDVLDAIKAEIDKHGEVCLYQEVVNLTTVEMDAIVDKLEFIKEVGLKPIKRIAFVTDKKWMQMMVKVEDKIFRNIEMKGFLLEEKDKALDFLQGE